jgi:hypothetical protein
VDPISRLQFCRQEIDRTFGEGHAKSNPDLVSVVMLTAAVDFAALQLAAAIERAALVLSEPDDNRLPGTIIRGLQSHSR